MNDTVLVIGATGTQGGATARKLLSRGRRVRILCRDPHAPAALELADGGAELVRGNLDDGDSIAAAMRGVAAVFSAQAVDTAATDSERRQGLALVNEAVRAGVRHFVHSSVAGSGSHAKFPRWGSGYWSERYWTDKWAVEEAVMAASFDSWTVLRPTFFMENFIAPKVDYMFPHLRQGELVSVLRASTRVKVICADDIAAFACASFEDPASFNHATITLSAEALSTADMARTLSELCGKLVVVVELTAEQAIARGMNAGWVRSQELRNELGSRAQIRAPESHGIAFTSFAEWVRRHRELIDVGLRPSAQRATGPAGGGTAGVE